MQLLVMSAEVVRCHVGRGGSGTNSPSKLSSHLRVLSNRDQCMKGTSEITQLTKIIDPPPTGHSIN